MNRIFKPNFKYTDKIVKNLIEIASAREAVLNSYLIPKWEVSLRKDALIRASHASTAIEGNPLTIEEVSMLAHGRKVTAADILEKPEYEGRYRELQVYVGNNKTGDVIFMPPAPEEVPGLVRWQGCSGSQDRRLSKNFPSSLNLRSSNWKAKGGELIMSWLDICNLGCHSGCRFLISSSCVRG